ncbi:hypothetical protein JNW90_10645 [Micromonospora sp. STR1s_5]|nr:hypothetical protein [Micromonospora sp. STR1s_5]
MSILDRFRRDAGPQPDYLAIPLTPDQVAQLVEGLHELDRLRNLHRPDIGGSGWGEDNARAVTIAAGTAAALGHTTVPVAVSDLRSFELNLHHMETWAPSSRVTTGFRQLMTRMHMLEGVARVHGWTARWKEPGGYQWDTPPTPPAGADWSAPRAVGQ